MLPNIAYDIKIASSSVGEVALDKDHGWVFGLPRGISTEEWPLDPVTGSPLMHGFTLLLPEQYRCHGPEIVGFSFFATPAELNDGGAQIDESFSDLVLNGTPATKPTLVERVWNLARLKSSKDPWRAYRTHAANKHPRLHRMTDILAYHYAIILLTQDEINGPQTTPPDLPMRDGSKPIWMERGAAAGLEPYQHKNLAADPESRIDWNLAIKFSPRVEDPNAGKTPQEDRGDGSTTSGYISPYNRENDYALHEWAKSHGSEHIGGTMRPVQAIPDMSTYYVEFEEYFGGYNFGSGNAQLDFKEMKFDWAC
ncbi:TPA: hypothetical protein ACQ30S_004107 [Yersinia enterocolitica]